MASGPVQPTIVTTRGIAPRKRRDVIAEACETRRYIIDFSEPDLGDNPLAIESEIRMLGPVEYWQSRGCANKRRTQSNIDQSPMNSLIITEQLDDGGAHYAFRGGRTSFDLARGDMLVFDLDVPFENMCRRTFAHRMWFVPKALIPGVELGSGGMRLESGVTTNILRTYLDHLRHALPLVSADVAMGYGQAIAPLLTAAVTPQADFAGRREGMAVARRVQIHRLVDDRLRDPALSPATIAEACRISLRTLHSLFADTGESFSDYVSRCRLDIARAELLDPTHAFRSVADIAFGAGFNGLSSFYARYRDRFGETPRDTRRLAAAPPVA